jgi:aminotransferase in exopolysaccharide biosynthesis
LEFKEIIKFIKSNYNSQKTIHLHEPVFRGNEKKYINEAIDSTFVSSIGKYVDRAELMISNLIGTKNSTAVVNGTSGIQVALQLAGVKEGDEVLTQALTFVATSNAILYNKANPVFIDVDLDTMGLSAKYVEAFLDENGDLRDDGCYNLSSGNKISACLPVHTFGFPVHLDELIKVCQKWKIPIVEDAAESLGSSYKGIATGSFGKLGVFSFNGNKIVTSGGGGMITTNNKLLGKKAKHLTTTAKVPNILDFKHDQLGFNFRMPNLNAALLCAQLEQLDYFLKSKRKLAKMYDEFFFKKGIVFRKETKNTKSNYWLMCVELENKLEKESFLKRTNRNNINCRPIWDLMFTLPMHKNFQRDEQKNAKFLVDRIVNIPSGVR